MALNSSLSFRRVADEWLDLTFCGHWLETLKGSFRVAQLVPPVLGWPQSSRRGVESILGFSKSAGFYSNAGDRRIQARRNWLIA